ncbi:MAG TPA: magnesium transporter [Clostridiaceae bacterium]|nr:magnesium transporter [Clostridiaceae bacterium]
MLNNEISRFVALLSEGRYAALQEALNDGFISDVAEFIEDLPAGQAAICFRLLHKDNAADVFAKMEGDVRTHLIAAFTDHEVQSLIEALFLDDAVDLVEELPANVVPRVLRSASPDTRKRLNHFLNFPVNSAGSIMTPEFMRLKKNWTVEFALRRIRTNGDEAASILISFVTDDSRHLEGIISIRDLLSADDRQLVADVMETHFIQVEVGEDRETVVALFHDHDLVNLPVVDAENRLVGLITFDDVMDVSEAEVTEDFEKMALVGSAGKPYLKTSVWQHAKGRSSWLMILMLSGIVNGGILGRFEHAFVATPMLVTFIPMLTDTGGNAGSQSSTMIIRGMAVGDISLSDFWSVVWKELRISWLVGLAMAFVNFGRLYFFSDHNWRGGLAVSLSLMVIVTISKLVGGALPLLAKKLKLDPAIMAAPLITTIVDALGLIIYFTIAGRLLGIS